MKTGPVVDDAVSNHVINTIEVVNTIGVVSGEIAKHIQQPPPINSPGTIRMYVLPSQLNAAEYPSFEYPVKEVIKYRSDNTGGPRGQLAVNLGVAQFILDNAANSEHFDDAGIHPGINNIREMGSISGVTLHNGYLRINTTDARTGGTFKTQLENMTVMAVQNIPVYGGISADTITSYAKAERHLPKNIHFVDLAYASAVPSINSQYAEAHVSTDDIVQTICNLTLKGQYTASLRIALQRAADANKPVVVYWMLLGGLSFGNKRSDIQLAMLSAVRQFGTTSMSGTDFLTAHRVTVNAFVFDKNHDEMHAFGTQFTDEGPTGFTKYPFPRVTWAPGS